MKKKEEDNNLPARRYILGKVLSMSYLIILLLFFSYKVFVLRSLPLAFLMLIPQNPSDFFIFFVIVCFMVISIKTLNNNKIQ